MRFRYHRKGVPAQLAWNTEGEKSITSDVPTPLFFKRPLLYLEDSKEKLNQGVPC